jgi:hypothetical protein
MFKHRHKAQRAHVLHVALYHKHKGTHPYGGVPVVL